MACVTGIGILLATALLVPGGTGIAEAQIVSPHIKQVWARQVDKLMREPSGWPPAARHEIGGLAFSNDGKWLALSVTHVQPEEGKKLHFNTHLLVLDVLSPEEGIRQFDLADRCGADLSWNEGEDAILVCGALVRLEDGKTCIVSPSPLPSITRFFSAHTAYWLGSRNVVRSNGEIVDMSCRPVDTWQLYPERRIGLGALSGSSGTWFLLSRSDGVPPEVSCTYSIVNKSSRRDFEAWPIPKTPCNVTSLVDAGSGALCFSVFTGRGRQLRCLSTAGGGEIAIPKQFRDYVPIAGATSTPILVAEKWTEPHFSEASALPTHRAVIDLTTTKEIASWQPRIQVSRSPAVEDWPYRCVISGDGEYIAESGGNDVEYYRIAA
jgi:hypothetical protein